MKKQPHNLRYGTQYGVSHQGIVFQTLGPEPSTYFITLCGRGMGPRIESEGFVDEWPEGPKCLECTGVKVRYTFPSPLGSIHTYYRSEDQAFEAALMHMQQETAHSLACADAIVLQLIIRETLREGLEFLDQNHRLVRLQRYIEACCDKHGFRKSHCGWAPYVPSAYFVTSATQTNEVR